jgi:hypothetical protein
VDFAPEQAIVGQMMRKIIRAIGLKIAHMIGTRITDYRSGRSFGRALIIPWRGKIHVIGLQAAVRPMFQPQKRLTYWKQEIVFTEHPPPDFPRGSAADGNAANPKAQNDWAVGSKSQGGCAANPKSQGPNPK